MHTSLTSELLELFESSLAILRGGTVMSENLEEFGELSALIISFSSAAETSGMFLTLKINKYNADLKSKFSQNASPTTLDKSCQTTEAFSDFSSSNRNFCNTDSSLSGIVTPPRFFRV